MTKIFLDPYLLECKRLGIKAVQTEIAEWAGVTRGYISSIARGRQANPSRRVLEAIADYFSHKLGRPITIDDLIEPKGTPAENGRNGGDGEQVDIAVLEAELNDIFMMYVDDMRRLKQMAETDPEAARPLMEEWKRLYSEALEKLRELRETRS